MSVSPFESDAVLIDRAIRGDTGAFGLVFIRHRDRVFRHALHTARAVADAEDVVAMTFLEAWRRRATLRIVGGSALPWLLVTATHVLQNQRRTTRRYRAALCRLPLDPVTHDHADRVLDDWETAQQREVLRTALSKLSRRDQEVIGLCLIEELSIDAVAEALRVPTGTVKSRLSRARTRLAELLRAEGTPAAVKREVRA